MPPDLWVPNALYLPFHALLLNLNQHKYLLTSGQPAQKPATRIHTAIQAWHGYAHPHSWINQLPAKSTQFHYTITYQEGVGLFAETSCG